MSKGYRIGLRICVLLLIFVAIWGISLLAADGNSEPPPAVEPDDDSPEIVDNRYRVLIDAGHGGRDPGATSITGVCEKELNLNLVLKLAALFRDDDDIVILLTRSDDTFYSPEERYEMANRLEPDIFISVHHNSYQGLPSVSGVETFYHHNYSRSLAAIMHKQLLDATGFKNRGSMKADYKVTKYSTMPAVLLEVGYLTNAEQERQLRDPAVQDKIAGAIAAGIRQHFAELEALAAAEAEQEAETYDSVISE